MSRWQRTVPFSADWQPNRIEQWEYRGRDRRARRFDVLVHAGKPFDVMSLKGIDLREAREYAAFLQRTAAQLYHAAARPLAYCPMCRGSVADAQVQLRVFGVPYLRCRDCGHVAVGLRPDADALDRLFAESEIHSATYVDPAAIEARMQQIIVPKLDWCIRQFQRVRLSVPQTLVDVGAGGGHFVAGAVRHGLQAQGFEKSQASRAFAKQAFGIDLHSEDFIAAGLRHIDLITFWGLLEYLPEPRDFLAAARRSISAQGLLVVEVPRADSLGTLVQATEAAVVARHMDPTTHVNAFSDESLCTALVEEGFAPVAAWYFGMDGYETVLQAALQSNADASALSWLIAPLQQAADRGRQCDDIVIAAVPLAE